MMTMIFCNYIQQANSPSGLSQDLKQKGMTRLRITEPWSPSLVTQYPQHLVSSIIIIFIHTIIRPIGSGKITFHIHFLNPECVRIPWVLAPKNFPVQNFRVRSVLQKSSIFHWFLLPPPKKKYRARVPTILMPQTFPIASLNRYTPNFSGVPQKLT